MIQTSFYDNFLVSLVRIIESISFLSSSLQVWLHLVLYWPKLFKVVFGLAFVSHVECGEVRTTSFSYVDLTVPVSRGAANVTTDWNRAAPIVIAKPVSLRWDTVLRRVLMRKFSFDSWHIFRSKESALRELVIYGIIVEV